MLTIYAYKLGRWDGFVRFCDIGGRTSLNLIDKILPIIEQQGFEIEIKDDRKEYKFDFEKVDAEHLAHINWPKGHTHEGQPIVLRDYQVKVINDFIANPQCLQEIATGAGKTIITATLSKMCQKYGRTIVIVQQELSNTDRRRLHQLGSDVGATMEKEKN